MLLLPFLLVPSIDFIEILTLILLLLLLLIYFFTSNWSGRKYSRLLWSTAFCFPYLYSVLHFISFAIYSIDSTKCVCETFLCYTCMWKLNYTTCFKLCDLTLNVLYLPDNYWFVCISFPVFPNIVSDKVKSGCAGAMGVWGCGLDLQACLARLIRSHVTYKSIES